MQKQKENIFTKKFRLLNSQENKEEIIWTSSESSDYEISNNNDKNCLKVNTVQNRKRKRKKKLPKNVSNLNITIIDVPKDTKEVNGRTSPILTYKNESKSVPHNSEKWSTSPILCSKNSQQSKVLPISKSPIILLKRDSPKTSPNVRKKLFNSKQVEENQNLNKKINRSISPVFQPLDRRKKDKSVMEIKDMNQNSKHPSNNFCSFDSKKTLSQNIKIEDTTQIQLDETKNSQNIDLDNSIALLRTTSIDLVRKVRSYFDSHFSSENASQHSISETATPKNSSKTSDEIDIMTCITQLPSKVSTQKEQTIDTDYVEKTKKVKYKKDGLAYRLNALLKKQNANISLWQHERYLAVNSNFVIPKGEHLVFRIRNTHSKYGCYLIEAVDGNDEKYVILINKEYVYVEVLPDQILKLYEPYKVLNFDLYKLIINVCKYECVRNN